MRRDWLVGSDLLRVWIGLRQGERLLLAMPARLGCEQLHRCDNFQDHHHRSPIVDNNQGHHKLNVQSEHHQRRLGHHHGQAIHHDSWRCWHHRLVQRQPLPGR